MSTSNLMSSLDEIHDTCTVGDLLLRALRRGEREALAFACGTETFTYGQCLEQLSQFLQALTAMGLRRGDAFACLSGNRVEAYLATSAASLLGVRVANLHPMGSLDDHEHLLRDFEATHLVFDPARFGARAAELQARIGEPLKLMSLGPANLGHDLMSLAAQRIPAPMESTATPDDIYWLIYTGGTTGKSKGVVHTHRSFVAVIMAELAEWEWPARTTFLAITPISHGAGPCILPVLLRGGTVVLADEFSAVKFLDLVQRHRVSATFLVPTMIYKLLDYLGDSRPVSDSLELVIYGAAPMAAARIQQAITSFGCVFMQLYGQSEAPNCVSVLRKSTHIARGQSQRLASCGQAIASNTVALLDAAGQKVAQGETGEICVRGPLVMSGYWKRPIETQEALRGGWLHTGDLARMDGDGYIYIVGRIKDMIITGGFNVYPAEIEEVLCADPAVSAAAVIGLHDAIWGEAVTAVIVLRPGCDQTADALIARVKAAKGAICTPKFVKFVDEIPVTGLGKPDKKALRERFSMVKDKLPVVSALEAS